MRSARATMVIAMLVLAGCAATPSLGDSATTPPRTPSPSSTPAREVGTSPVGCPADLADAATRPGTLRGINAAGGEFTHTPEGLPGVQGQQYRYAGAPLLPYLAERGHCLVRVPFRWERVQQELGGELSAEGLAELRTAVTAAADAGLLVLLDMHNYGTYFTLGDELLKLNEGLTAADLADAWGRLAEAFADEPAVVGWGLMNEPNALVDPPSGPTTWHVASQAAVDAIRATGDTRAVFVSGDKWGGANQWAEKNGDPWIVDPADNVVYEAHYYFAPDNSGAYEETYAELEADAVGRGYANLSARIDGELGDFVTWLDEHDQQGFVGEIGWPSGADDDLWNAAGDHAYDLLDAAGIGATYWATGEYWRDGYPLNAYDHETLTAQPQAAVIEEHLASPQE